MKTKIAEMCETQDTVVSNSGVAQRHIWQGPGPPKCLLCSGKRLRFSNRTVKHSIKAVGKHNLLCK